MKDYLQDKITNEIVPYVIAKHKNRDKKHTSVIHLNEFTDILRAFNSVLTGLHGSEKEKFNHIYLQFIKNENNFFLDEQENDRVSKKNIVVFIGILIHEYRKIINSKKFEDSELAQKIHDFCKTQLYVNLPTQLQKDKNGDKRLSLASLILDEKNWERDQRSERALTPAFCAIIGERYAKLTETFTNKPDSVKFQFMLELGAYKTQRLYEGERIFRLFFRSQYGAKSKTDAVVILMDAIDKGDNAAKFTSHQLEALLEGRAGKIVERLYLMKKQLLPTQLRDAYEHKMGSPYKKRLERG